MTIIFSAIADYSPTVMKYSGAIAISRVAEMAFETTIAISDTTIAISATTIAISATTIAISATR